MYNFYYCNTRDMPQRQGPTTTVTIMASAGEIGPLQPPMRPFIPHWCVWSIKDDPLSNLISLLWGLEECLTRLPIPVFRNPFLNPRNLFLPGFLRIFFSEEFLHRNVVLKGFWKFLFSATFTRFFCRNFCGTEIPVFAQDSFGFLRIPVPAKSCLV